MIRNRTGIVVAPDEMLVDKTCCQCGQLFQGRGLMRKCKQCRKPSREDAPKSWDDGCGRGKALSQREKQLLPLVRQGKLNKEIAAILHLTEGTVKIYVSRIFLKVGVTNRTELAIWAHCEACPMKQSQAA